MEYNWGEILNKVNSGDTSGFERILLVENQNTVINVLARQFKIVPVDVQENVKAIQDLGRLIELVELAATVKSINHFREQLNQ